MFILPKKLKRLMKDEYKTGLVVAKNLNTWYLAGKTWEIEFHRSRMNKMILSSLIELVGELPDTGERYVATKFGNQMEIGESKIRENDDTMTLLKATSVLIATNGLQRMLQNELTGEVTLVDLVFDQLMSNEIIEVDKGDTMIQGPYLEEDGHLLYQNNTCKLRALKSGMTRKDEELLERLAAVELT